MKKDLLNKFLSLKGQVNNPDLFILSKQLEQEVSSIINLKYEDSESRIQDTSEYIYQGIEEEALLTNYFDYFQILDDFEGKVLVDLGAGYCKGSLLNELLGLDSRCLSVEIEKSRVAMARSHIKDESVIIQGDLLSESFLLPKADAYFLYMPTGIVLNSILSKIINQKIEADFYVIESHGDFIDVINYYPELFMPIESNLNVSQPRHDKKIYKYKSKLIDSSLQNIEKNNLSIKTLPYWILKYSNEDTFVEIESKIANSNDYRSWVANLKDSQLINYNGEFALQLFFPSRILQLETQDKIVKITQA